MRVLMSAAASPAAISILRHLRSLGHTVVGMDAALEAEPLGRAHCDAFYVAPLARSSEYLSFLCERLAEVDIFLPFLDEELVAIADAWEGLPVTLRDRIAISFPEVLRECVDKCRFQEACRKKQLPIAPVAIEAPAFFKPRYGRGGRGVISVTDNQLFAALEGRDGVMQQAIEGEEFTVDAMFDRNHRLIATSPRRRLRSAGVSTVGEVVPDENLSKLAARIGAAWRFRYAINFQVIRDGQGQDWIIELNPRLAGSALFSAFAGCDPFAATIALWNGEPWSGSPRRLRVWRYWQEQTSESLS